MKSTRGRLTVNLDELDRVLDGARQAPLNEDDYEKLKCALHAMAALLVRPRNTEKTSAVLEKQESKTDDSAQPDANTPPPGHGRNGAAAFESARKVSVAHQNLAEGTVVQSVKKGMYTGRRSRRCWCGS